MRSVFSIAVVAILVCTGSAVAQQSSNMHEEHLDYLDLNDDDAIGESEYRSFMTSAFTRLDANGDGDLDQSELSSILSPDQFAATDADGDGKVGRQEFFTQVMRDFQAADRSGDGQLR